eukprot:scaffold13450_cov99-Amphora_coffeaeformis.AAC.3
MTFHVFHIGICRPLHRLLSDSAIAQTKRQLQLLIYQTTPIYSLPMMRVINPTTDKCKSRTRVDLGPVLGRADAH